jgi:hypothetical protein
MLSKRRVVSPETEDTPSGKRQEMGASSTNRALFDGFDFSGVDFSAVDGLDLGSISGAVSEAEHEDALASLGDMGDIDLDLTGILEDEDMATKKTTSGKKNPVGRPKKAATATKATKATKATGMKAAEPAMEKAEEKVHAAEVSTQQLGSFLATEAIEAVDRLTSDVSEVKRDLSTVRGFCKDACTAATEAREYAKACHEGMSVILSAVTARADAQDQILHDINVLIHNDGRNPVGDRLQEEISAISSGLNAVQETLDGLKGTLGKLTEMQTLVHQNGGIMTPTTKSKAPSLGSQAISQPQNGSNGKVGVDGVSAADMAIVEKMAKRQTKKSPLNVFSTALSGHLRKQGRHLTPDQIQKAVTRLGLVDEEGNLDPNRS